jgi:hypothetical protein
MLSPPGAPSRSRILTLARIEDTDNPPAGNFPVFVTNTTFQRQQKEPSYILAPSPIRREPTAMHKTIVFLLLLSAVLAVAPKAHTQTMPLGTLTINGTDPFPCSVARNGSKFLAGMNCFNATVDCSMATGAQALQLTFGWTAPANPQGTIVFFSGGPGTSPTEDGDDIPAYATNYVNNFVVVYVEWNDTPWEDPTNGGGGNILAAACRPATFLNYINSSSIRQKAMCAHGSSAGSAAIAYSMAW